MAGRGFALVDEAGSDDHTEDSPVYFWKSHRHVISRILIPFNYCEIPEI